MMCAADRHVSPIHMTTKGQVPVGHKIAPDVAIRNSTSAYEVGKVWGGVLI